jgi:hypothetical protein
MEERKTFSTVLLEDMTAAFKRLKENQPSERRTAIRVAFAAVEGHLAMLSQELLAKAGDGLTETERMALREENYRVDDSGKIHKVTAYLPLKSRVKLVTSTVKRLHPEYAIDFQGSEWQALLKGLDARDKITHPKDLTDMNVEFAEVQAAVTGVFWFLVEVIAPGHAGIAAYLKKNPPKNTLADIALFGPGVPLSELLSSEHNKPDPGEGGAA